MVFGRIIALAAAGACGTLARYGLAGLVQRWAGRDWPWGTLAVNALGCLLAGVFWSVAESRLSISPHWRAVVLIGFMGAFTTFSSLCLETSQLARDAEWLAAGANLVANNVAGVVCVIVGLALGRML